MTRTGTPHHPNRVAVVIGSSRPTRVCPDIAAWLCDCLGAADRQDETTVAYELLDLAALDLPFLDEPRIPALGDYAHDHTKAWSATVADFDGFFFVFPQYNWGYPAVLKNAVDFLYREWNGKPVSLATYGSHGGSQAASQFQSVLTGLRMNLTATHLEITVPAEHLDDSWQIRNVGSLLAPYEPEVRQIATELGDALAGLELAIDC